MTAYRYRAARADGVMVRGTIEASAAGQAGIAVTELGPSPGALQPTAAGETAQRAASRRDLALVFRSVSALVSAGVPLERAVGARESLARGALRETLARARAGLHEGQSVAQALSAGRGVVPGVVLGMIRAGERGSQLGAALEQVATHLEQEAELVARVRQALAYPLLLAIAGTVSVLVIGTVIVPRFADLLGDLGQDLPVATRFLIGGSALLSHFWFVLIPLGLALVWAGLEGLKRPTSRHWIDQTLLSITGLVGVRLARATSRVARALGGMLRAGMPLLPALEAASDAAGDEAVAERLTRGRGRVAQGAPLTAAPGREAGLAPSALPPVAVGEARGRP